MLFSPACGDFRNVVDPIFITLPTFKVQLDDGSMRSRARARARATKTLMTAMTAVAAAGGGCGGDGDCGRGNDVCRHDLNFD